MKFATPFTTQEIRHSALEVLFDTLKYHGGTFAESFWKRIFDSVLLPIFDHVRAEVRASRYPAVCVYVNGSLVSG